MDRLIHTAMTGMQSSHAKLRMIASNMANAQTIGFRAEMMNHVPITLKGDGLEARVMTSGEVVASDLSAGAIIQTGRTLDMALSGNAMLAVQAQDGSEGYTRRGDLSVSASGILTNGDDLPVLGASGVISIPPGLHIAIADDGTLTASDPANPDQPPQVFGQLKLVSITPRDVAKGIDGQFRALAGGALPQDLTARLTSGALEQSNVNPTAVLVDMIEAQRLFDMRTKIMSTARDLDQGGASLMRLNS